MPTFGLFYGSTEGHTQRVAETIRDILVRDYGDTVDLLDIAEFYLEEMQEYDFLILGVPTWNTGQLQRDWEDVFEEFDAIDLTGRKVAIFGLGDQVDYPHTFLDAMAFVADKVRERGGVLVGRWPNVGYAFVRSWALEDGEFLGLALDEHNQPELTVSRLKVWLAQVRHEFGIVDSTYQNEDARDN
jgi:flavodoxin long chain